MTRRSKAFNPESNTSLCRRSSDPLGEFASLRTTSYKHKTIRIAASSGKFPTTIFQLVIFQSTLLPSVAPGLRELSYSLLSWKDGHHTRATPFTQLLIAHLYSFTMMDGLFSVAGTGQTLSKLLSGFENIELKC